MMLRTEKHIVSSIKFNMRVNSDVESFRFECKAITCGTNDATHFSLLSTFFLSTKTGIKSLESDSNVRSFFRTVLFN